MAETCVFASDLTCFEGLVWKLMNLQIKWGQCSEWHDWYKGFKEQQTTVWSAISKARASLRAISIYPETQQRAAEQILQTTRCKNGSLKCQVSDSFHLNSSLCLMFIGHASERVREEKGTLHYDAGSSATTEDQERMSSRTTTRKTKQPLLDVVYLSGNCSDFFIEVS